MNGKNILKRLNDLYDKTPTHDLSQKNRIVIFSDLHLGNGKSCDDFVHNGDLFLYLLKNYYSPRHFHLVLNGDVEELYKFPLKQIRSRWRNIYNALEDFQQQQNLTKLVGNHDYSLFRKKEFISRFPITDAWKFSYKNNIIFVFHGHQAEFFFGFMQPLIVFLIRFIALPLGIKNYSVAFNSRKRYLVEKRVYEFARSKKILAVIGHTHRPLFESLSKIDSLKFDIEKFCREYLSAQPARQKELEVLIGKYKAELQNLLHKRKRKQYEENIYARIPMAPCMFNSGCCIRENGVTAIEICDGNIEMVFWFDKKRTEKYFAFGENTPVQLQDSDYWRVSLEKKTLDDVTVRVRLLS